MLPYADSIILNCLPLLNSFQFGNINLANIKIYKPKQAPKLLMRVKTRHLESILYFFFSLSLNHEQDYNAYNSEAPKEKWAESQSNVVAYAAMKAP